MTVRSTTTLPARFSRHDSKELEAVQRDQGGADDVFASVATIPRSLRRPIGGGRGGGGGGLQSPRFQGA